MNKVMLITGTRKGIGKGLADYYLDNGFIVAGCSRKPGRIDHERYRHYQLDVADEEQVVQMVQDVVSGFGTIHVLINNAGIASMNHLILTPAKSVEEILRTNVLGTFLFIREVSKVMIRHKSGRIVNFTTVAAPLRLEGEAMYAASKSAVANLTQTASKELGKFGITVNAIGPSPVKTDLIKHIPQEKIDRLLETQAITGFANFEDVANVINFFIDEKSDFVTGQIIYLGGIHG